MNTVTQQMTDILTNKYGPFLSINQLAEVLDRYPRGLRITLSQDSLVSKKFEPARTQVGRRIYFNVVSIAEIMTEDAHQAQ